ESERLDLADRRQLLAKVRIEQPQEERAQPLAGCRDIAEPEARVDEHQLARGLDEDAPARELAAQAGRPTVHQAPTQRARRDAVEVMEAHACEHSKSRARSVRLLRVLRVDVDVERVADRRVRT